NESSSTSNSEGESEKKEKLIVGTDAAFAPFEYMDKGEIVGFDMDFLDAVMKEAGYEWEPKNIGWDPLFEAVRQGKEVDMAISGITIN
ncbi:transporter substrate-binding domain-containing protein, partial [Micrococcus sp. SIMBA_131]